ncbi:MAG TPA: FAD-binding domain-containing protein [Actinocrinis sp.]|uniref:FAD-binding domain-containing protein n=1 Tax=Actinocrinis sp. TaxID=1920516 RepID=UPI002D31D739|nr:FAD-binding domain-containing protein [Actinocrinis sp.]HZU56027.1 FAD-binding domain-containing protein [Actinocrinis sp.]
MSAIAVPNHPATVIRGPAKQLRQLQWVASGGVDPRPAFHRVYNPTPHLERYDPEGEYVHEYAPELRWVPRGHLAEPWTMPMQAEV